MKKKTKKKIVPKLGKEIEPTITKEQFDALMKRLVTPKASPSVQESSETSVARPSDDCNETSVQQGNG